MCIRDRNIAEASSSNLFFVKDGIVHTPSKKQACVLGVMRGKVLDILTENGIPCKVGKVKRAELLKANEVFLTNAIQGIRWVKRIEDEEFQKGKIIHLLMENLQSPN